MRQNLIKKSDVNVAKVELLNEVLPNPLAVVKRLNKLSRVEGSRVRKIFELCEVPYNKLTFDFFTGYSFNVVDFGCPSASVLGSFSTSQYEGFADFVRPSACTPLIEGDHVIMTVKDPAVCASSRLVFVNSRGDVSAVRPSLGDSDTIDYDYKPTLIGVGVLENSPLVWLDLMRIIGNKTIKENARMARLLARNNKVIEKARKECERRMAALGSVEVSDFIKGQIYNSCLAWARQKVG